MTLKHMETQVINKEENKIKNEGFFTYSSGNDIKSLHPLLARVLGRWSANGYKLYVSNVKMSLPFNLQLHFLEFVSQS